MEILKVLHEWPLSKVELVEKNGAKLIRKSIHIDFKSEIEIQQAIRNVAQSFIVPEIYEVEETDDLAIFYMEYFESISKPSEHQVNNLLRTFHDETRSLMSNEIFDVFRKEDLENDVQQMSIYGDLPEEIKGEGFFDEVFENNTLIHGDWGSDQIIVSERGPVIIDFGKSLISSPILDIAHNIRFNSNKYLDVTDTNLQKAIIAVDVMRMAWFDYCKNNYIDYAYEDEMRESVNAINEVCSVFLKTEQN